ncbi:peptidase M3 [Pseudoalteromonas luteoviolacea CPMOR-1]|uniref:Peptidase M3 n=1 Tax=Pseudoalteromonas luteoviolacea CPMOR-1 TaxID=1365248 RepID=A0A161YYD3_9GAMM|nr:M3 family metallopeptidase [Pseudoalteromonas luteoviolacea]KZN68250.1 peptidase M3 [Pseudoalteromonas luteoviolacea CPMOR-1]
MLRKTHLALAISAAMLLNGCSDAPEQQQTAQVEATDTASAKAAASNIAQNPFFQEWNTPFGAPPLGDIKTEHFLPAFNQAIVEHKKEIDAITENERPADFDNTIAAMELAGSTLNRVSMVFGNLANTESNDEMQSLQREISPMLTRHYSDIRMNEALFKRIATVYDNRKSALLNAEQTRLLERIYNSFVRSGAKLTGEERAEFAKINERLSALTTEFGQNSLNDSRAFTLVLEESDLAGLPQAQRDAAAAAAAARDLPGKYVITLNRSSVQPFLQFSDRRDLREKAFKGWANRGDNDNEFDNKAIIAEIVELRAKRAQLLGFKHHSEYVLTNSMASKPETAMDLLLKVWEPAVEKAEQERQWIKELMAAEGVTHELEAWDWRYYAEKVRKAKFDLDQGQIAEYFELNNMIEAQFYTAERLFGLKFVERTDIPVYNPVVRVWEVQDKAGKAIGLFYGDYYARSTKRSGAWMSSFRSQQKLAGDVKPLILNNMNLNKPAEGEPTLMSYSDAETLFHEFGHALHGLLSNVTYPTLAGTSVPRDWVEFPAQLFEHFIAQPEMLKKFALHYKTNKPMPEELLEKIKQAGTFNQGFATVEFTASALVDMAYHQLTDVKDLDVRAFENKILTGYGKPEEIIMRHRSTHFGHIFAGGYSSAYYAYMWSEILDADGFDAFLEKKDIFDKETAERLYQFIYSRGDTLDYFEAYEGFRGRKPTTDALLRNRGLD